MIRIAVTEVVDHLEITFPDFNKGIRLQVTGDAGFILHYTSDDPDVPKISGNGRIMEIIDMLDATNDEVD